MPDRSHLLFKVVAALCVLTIFIQPATSQTVADGGVIDYKFLRVEQVGDWTFNVYGITAKIYKECSAPGNLPSRISLDVFLNSSFSNYQNIASEENILRTDSYITSQYPNSCSSPNERICYQVGVYTTELFLLTIPNDFIVAYQGGDRRDGAFVNIDTHNPLKLSPGVMGYTFATYIPGWMEFENGPYSASGF
jgi:hypothetical protein